jgi:hypothetical protein
MYNFGRVTREIGPERYCDGSEMGTVLGCIGAFPPNFITPVRGNRVRKSGQRSAESAGTLSLPEFATKFPSYNLSNISPGRA